MTVETQSPPVPDFTHAAPTKEKRTSPLTIFISTPLILQPSQLTGQI